MFILIFLLTLLQRVIAKTRCWHLGTGMRLQSQQMMLPMFVNGLQGPFPIQHQPIFTSRGGGGGGGGDHGGSLPTMWSQGIKTGPSEAGDGEVAVPLFLGVPCGLWAAPPCPTKIFRIFFSYRSWMQVSQMSWNICHHTDLKNDLVWVGYNSGNVWKAKGVKKKLVQKRMSASAVVKLFILLTQCMLSIAFLSDLVFLEVAYALLLTGVAVVLPSRPPPRNLRSLY